MSHSSNPMQGWWQCVECRRIFGAVQGRWGCPYCLTSEELRRNGEKHDPEHPNEFNRPIRKQLAMKPVYLDFETFWSQDHTLSKMAPTEYVMHPDTEIISCGIKVGDAPTDVIFGEDEVKRHLKALDWSQYMAVGHNMSGFDSMLLRWRCDIKPKMYGCTAAMARSRYSKTATMVDGKMMVGVSLKKLAVEHGIGKKLDLEATNTRGKHLRNFTPGEVVAMEAYNREDVELCARLFKFLAKGFPKKEMLLIDMTTCMLVEPAFELDTAMVQLALVAVKEEKRQALLDLANMLDLTTELVTGRLEGDSAGIEEAMREQLASSVKFGELLVSRGCEVPTKPSPSDPSKSIPALAKTDDEFIALQDHADPIVAAAARARLGVKSTILETRLQAFLRAGAACGGMLPVPLKYCGADTTGRWSGEQYNMQNLTRVPRNRNGEIIKRASNALRLACRAPRGKVVIVADQSAIEMRVNHFLWKVEESMEMYQQDPKADLYRAFAAVRYGIDPEAVDDEQRRLGKVAQLGLGFGAAAGTFRKAAKFLGGLNISEEDALEIVQAWRSTYTSIVEGWGDFQAALPAIAGGREQAIDPWGMCVTEKDAVRLPSGRCIHYPGLHKVKDEVTGRWEWKYGWGRTEARIYAGKGVENIVSGLARDTIAHSAGEFLKQTGMKPALMVHDELAYVVPRPEAKAMLAALQTILRAPPPWWPELITWSEGDVAASYGEAK